MTRLTTETYISHGKAIPPNNTLMNAHMHRTPSAQENQAKKIVFKLSREEKRSTRKCSQCQDIDERESEFLEITRSDCDARHEKEDNRRKDGIRNFKNKQQLFRPKCEKSENH